MVIEVGDLHKRYGRTVAVEDVSFRVERGEILGPNGAGKTTSVECLAGLRAPDRGTVSVLGLDPVRERGELTQRVGVQPQSGALPEKMKVAEALALYGNFYRRPADRRRLLDDLGLTGLDPRARRDTWRLIEDVRDRASLTVVPVTHFMEEAERLCDRIAVIDAGRVAAVDTPAQAREAGVLDERARMAREIHDTLAQGFTGVIAQPEAARQNPGQWQRFTGQAQALARENLDEARRSVQALRPEYLEDAHLPEAIAGMSGRWSRTSGVAIGVETTGEPRPMLADLEVALFRVAQEALNNVAKHARASRVGLTLSYMDDVVLLDVRDDGVGFEPEARRAGGSAWPRCERRGRPRGREQPRRGHRRERERAGPAGRRRSMIRLLIVDDHPIVRDGPRGVFAAEPDLRVVGEASDGAEALPRAGEADVVLMDPRMPAWAAWRPSPGCAKPTPPYACWC